MVYRVYYASVTSNDCNKIHRIVFVEHAKNRVVDTTTNERLHLA